MSDSTTDTTAAEAEGQGGKDSGETPAAENGFKPITSQKQLNAVITERLDRERAKFKDYDDLKAKAGEKQTLEERIAEMEQRAQQAEAKTLRSDIAIEFGISKEDRDLFLTATDEDTLRAQAKRLADRDADRKKNPPPVSKEGTVTDPTDNQDREFARQLFGRG